MKKIFFAAVFGLAITAASAQSNKNDQLSVCRMTKDSIAFGELEKCGILTLTDPKLKIRTFTLSMLAKGKDGKPVYIDFKGAGNVLPADGMEFMKKNKANVAKVVIEKVIAVNGDGSNETKIPNIVFYLK